jgi:hypothetical protein
VNRREALQAGIGILSAVGIEGEIATMTPKNPQAFVITTPKCLSTASRDYINAEWKRAFKGTELENVPVIVMTDGMQLSVVDKETP